MLKYENVCFYTKIHNRILRILNKRSNIAISQSVSKGYSREIRYTQ